MIKPEKINKKIDSLYSKIFDSIETKDYREVLWSTRDRFVGRFFRKIKEREESLSKIEESKENFFIQQVNENIEEFKNTFGLNKEVNPKLSREEINQIAYAKGEELIYSSIDQGIESKKVFKHIIETTAKELNLSQDQVIKLKSFVIEYIIQREKVNTIYTTFAGSLENISMYVLGKNILKEKGVEIKKGKLGLEIFLPEEIYKKIIKKESNGQSTSLPNYIYAFPEMIERPGGMINVIFIKDMKKNQNESQNLNEDLHIDVLSHERQHAKYFFIKKRREKLENVSDIKIDNELIKLLTVIKGDFNIESYNNALTNYFVRYFDEEYKDEFLAQITGLENKNLLIASEILLSSYDYRQITNFKYREFLKDLKGIYTNFSDEEISNYTDICYSNYKDLIQKNCLSVVNLIKKYPNQKSFFISYFSRIRITEWEKAAFKIGNLNP